MVNKKICLGMLVIALAFGVVLAGCDNGSTGGGGGGGANNSELYGTWTKPSDTSNPDHFTFTESGFSYVADGIGDFTGTFSYTAPTITFKIATSTGLAQVFVQPGKSHTGKITKNGDGSITFSNFTTGLTLLNGETWAQEGR
jgi:hypothetical protein